MYCDSLSGISLPNCREIDAGGFQYCSSMRCAHLPKVTTLNGNVFQQDAMLTDIYLPSLKEFANTALISGDFRECGFPEPLDLPKIEFTQKGTFTTLYLKRLEFSQVQVIRRLNLISLDETNYRDKSIDVILPSTLREIQGYSEGSNYTVYGTKGTYAEQWANENEFEFVEITPETAVITDLPESFYDYMRYLEVDVIGFNRTYQWYGSYADQNTGGVPIVGATERRFVPKENEQYPYYYCVVTSTDVGYDPIEIRTGASKYMEFSSETPGADYSVGDIIEYGLYPQSEVKDQETINKLISAADPDIISYGYFSGTGSWDDGEMALSDFMSYRDVAYKGNIYRIVGVDDYRPYYTGGTSSSNYQQQNGYCAPGLYCFKFEPIKWRVLDSESGLVICDSAIDSQPFNNFVLKSGTDSKGNDVYWGDTDQTYYANNYAKSSIREWLNNDFYNTAFSDSQKENIKTTTITNTGYFTLNGHSGYEEYDSGETNDKIFLLSYEDVNNESYWTNSPKPISKSASATEYAACQGLLSTSDSDCSWWLRTSNNSDTSSIINCGSVGFETVGKTSIGVVPAMKLNTLINEPITYTATFVADGNVVDIVDYYSGTGEVIEPVPPAKEGYWWHWDNYELTGNITINAIYETIGYIACFVNGNNIIAQIPYTIETENITPPPVPEKAGYTSEWEDYSLEVGGITVQVLFTPNIYEVDLVVDGEVIGTIDYTYDDENPDLPTVPEKKGYTGEWVINQDDGNVDIHAEYTPINYYATFMADGNQVGDKVPFTVESISIIEPAVPEKEGYENGRWEDYTLGATDITINAVYDKIEGTCSHVDSNDDGKCDKCCEPMIYTKDIIVDGVKIGEVTFTYGDSIIDNLPDVPAKTGYTGEWEYTINGSNLDIHPQYTPITYYATFKADGNQVGEKVPFTVESESITAPEVPTKEGYTGAWSEYTITASDITVNAIYTVKEYTASFIVDGEIISTEDIEFGSSIALPDEPQKAGYTFKKWLPEVPETMPNNSLTFTAQFEPITYYASFMAEGVEIGRVPFTVETESIIAPDVPTKEGYSGSWSEYVIAASDITINAIYTVNKYTASFIVNGETISTEDIEFGSSIVLPDDPEKAGYAFIGWAPDIPGTMPNESVTFTAEFEPITYYASFMADGEEIEKVPFTVESKSISEPEIPEKEGYTGKWSEFTLAASDITVNAIYTVNEYTASFIVDGETISTEDTKFGSPMILPDNPQKAGYIFREWLPEIPETMPAKDMTFYAVFEEVKQPDDNPPEAVNPSVDIRNFAYTSTVDYRTTITFTAITKDMPKDATIVWYLNGQKSGEGEKLTVKEVRESFNIQAKIVDKNSDILNSSETELVKVKTDFFSKIIAFFRMLFGKLPVIEQ
ncbi:MAG: InlB B-repeat-containing protein [Clostridia bacterium]|nr:InlB B-repeat-containing protein [Clostridia bacterium]